MKGNQRLLIFLLCGLIGVSVFLAYRARAETYTCPSPRAFPCVPEVLPPDSVRPDCEVERPSLRRCEHRWRKPLIADAVRCSQSLCFSDVQHDKLDKLQRVARLSTLDILRVIGR